MGLVNREKHLSNFFMGLLAFISFVVYGLNGPISRLRRIAMLWGLGRVHILAGSITHNFSSFLSRSDDTRRRDVIEATTDRQKRYEWE